MPIKTGAFGGDATPPLASDQQESKPAKRTRRKKEDLINDVVIPGQDDTIEVKFTATGNKGERPWNIAVELFREGKVEFVTKDPTGIDLKYAVEKMDRQQSGDPPAPKSPDLDPSSTEGLTLRWQKLQEMIGEQHPGSDIEALNEESELVRKQIVELGGSDPAAPDTGAESGKKGSESVPPDADVGDIVRIGADTYRVGHGGVLTQGPVSVDGEPALPKRAWQRELGTGGNGEWQVVETFPQDAVKPPSNGHKDAPVEQQVVDPEMREVAPGIWKVGTGVLEKIGLPEYSSLQIGPNTMSTAVLDDGRRTKTKMPHGDEREVVVPTAVVEAYGLCADTVEYVSSLQRRQLIAFLEAAKPGSTQPQ